MVGVRIIVNHLFAEITNVCNLLENCICVSIHMHILYQINLSTMDSIGPFLFWGLLS